MTFDQAEFEIRCEWALRGLNELAPISDVLIIVDVLSFTTALDIATARGALVFPYPLKGQSAQTYAASLTAQVASGQRESGYSLSPASLLSLPANYRLVLPSANGAAMAFAANHPVLLAGSLRNATATAKLAARLGSTFAVIPAGETGPSGELRPCFEDWVGAGAVISALPGRRSPEADLAAESFERYRDKLSVSLRQTSSGKELIERGFSLDVEIASELDSSRNVPRLQQSFFTGIGFHRHRAAQL
jgi:2-phosphosulfolactate phosphatase